MRIVGETEFELMLDSRRGASFESAAGGVVEIVSRVRAGGDAALLECIRQFDQVDLDASRLEVSASEFDEACDVVEPSAVEAIRYAIARVRQYCEATKPPASVMTGVGGTIAGRVRRPLSSVGLYVPGGRKPYVSTVIMTAVPAKVAGVPLVVLCTPPRGDGSVDPHILVACRECGVDRVFRAGGAHAVAAMAYGTETIPRVDKIAGPGNRFVTAAKRLVFGDVGIDSLAGPSEVAIIADDSADPALVAADLMAQAEHGPDSLAVLFSTSVRLSGEVSSIVHAISRAESADAGRIVGVRCDSVGRAVSLSNRLAPEHLQIMVEQPSEVVPLVRAAGAILVGRHSPAALGDYVAGPSHVLPTGGSARFSSGLTVDDFSVTSSLVWEREESVRQTAAVAATLADIEGFDAHARALRARLGESV